MNNGPGDFNGDGAVDAADYTVWRDSLGQSVSPMTGADSNGDGLITQLDHTLWLENFGQRYFIPVVNSLGDIDDGDPYNGVTTLREAITYINLNPRFNRITFDPSLSGGLISVGDGRISRSGHIFVESNVILDASALEDRLTLRANSRFNRPVSRLFIVGNGDSSDLIPYDLTLIGLDLINGGSAATIDSISWGHLTLIDSTISGSSGSAISNWGPVTLIDSHISGAGSNTSFQPGAVQSQVAISLTRSTVSGAEDSALALGRSRAFDAQNAPQIPPRVELIDSTISDNGGNGITAVGEVILTDSSVIRNGQVKDDYSAIAAAGADVTLVRSRVDDNQSGGINSSRVPTYYYNSLHDYPLNGDGSVTLIDSSVSGNTSRDVSDGAAAGIVARRDVSLTRSRVENNRVLPTTLDRESKGGGISAGGKVYAIDSHINGNRAFRAGGIYAQGIDRDGHPYDPQINTVELVNSEVNGNHASSVVIAIESQGSISINESSINQNTFVIPEGFVHSAEVEAIIRVNQLAPDNTRISVTDSTISNNGFPDSTAIYRRPLVQTLQNTDITFLRSEITNNNFGGVAASSITDSIVSGNRGVGVFLQEKQDGTAATVVNSQILNHPSNGIVVRNASAIITDSVIRGNSTNNYAS